MIFRVLFFIVVSVFITCVAVCDSEETKRKVDQFEMVARTGILDGTQYTREEIEKAILKTRGDDTSNPVAVSESYRNAVVNGFDVYGDKYKLPKMLFVGMGLKESEFRTDKEGKLGEKGILQVGKMGRRRCASECGKFSSDPGVQICHGYCWFSKIQQSCDGSVKQGLSGYASGDCVAKSIETKKAVRRRYRLWGWLHIKLERTF